MGLRTPHAASQIVFFQSRTHALQADRHGRGSPTRNTPRHTLTRGCAERVLWTNCPTHDNPLGEHAPNNWISTVKNARTDGGK
eukprot:15479698-Alexandrium_andersonii.AAC.1